MSKQSKKAKMIISADEIEFKRHPFGIVTFFIALVIALVLCTAFLLFLWDSVISLLMIAIMLVASLFIFKFTSYIYYGNRLIVSKTSITQITRRNLFSSKTSILGLANIEDVTTHRNPVIAHYFDYGTLRIETAGEQDNFLFTYCTAPEECAKKLMQLREEYLKDNSDQKLR